MVKQLFIAAVVLGLAGTAAAAPVAPSGLSVSVVANTVTLTWLHPEAGNVVFRLEAGTAPGLSNAAVVTLRDRSLVATSVPAGTYYVRVRAVSVEGDGPPSAEVTVRVTGGGPVCTTVPDAPQAFTISAATAEDRIDFGWQPPTGLCIPTGYLMQVGSRPGASDLATLNITSGFVFEYDVPSAVYYVRLIAVNAFGTSPPSNEVAFAYQRCVQPPNPPRLAGTASGSNITLVWERPISGCNPVDYVIVAGSAPGQSDLGSVRVGNTLGFTGTISPGTYFVRVLGVGVGGPGAPSNEIRLVVR